MTRKQKKTLWRIIFSFVLLAAAALLPEIEVPFNMWPYFGQPLVNEAGEPYYAFPRLYLFLIPYLCAILKTARSLMKTSLCLSPPWVLWQWANTPRAWQ